MTFNTVLDQVTYAKPNLFLLNEEILYHHHHVNLILLDFCKSFDTVAHNRLLKFYGIQGIMIGYLTGLMQKNQCVLLDGFSFNYVKVESGVSQGTVLSLNYHVFTLYQ